MSGLSCSTSRSSCERRDRGEHHALPSRCIQDFWLEVPLIRHERHVPCSFYVPIEHYRERMPAPGGGWIRPIMTPMGFAPRAPLCAAATTTGGAS